MEDIADILQEAVREGNKALQGARSGLMYRHKTYKELVTNCDIASENAIAGFLSGKFQNAKIFSEEVGEIVGDEEIVFIIDPLDGTHNFIHNIPFYAISIGVYSKGVPFAGVIYLPEFQDCLYAVKNEGAYLNGQVIHCSDTERLGESLIAYDNQFHKHESMLKNLSPLSERCFTLRIFGSACVDLCGVARGWMEARIFHQTKLVDFAAGQVIVEEAGGKVTDFQGRPLTLQTTDVLASNGRIHSQLVELLGTQKVDSRLRGNDKVCICNSQ
ncbi:MAG: inositol monophosphatase [Sedimentisphaerales bacterium]|nr:inositol monophosphatase [Sedimentisphaerales bacterium]